MKNQVGNTRGICAYCGLERNNAVAGRTGFHGVCLQRMSEAARKSEGDQNRFILEPYYKGGQDDVFWERRADGLYTNVLRVVVWHSPTGYEVGYAGSGPADFALNIAENFMPHRPLTDREKREGVVYNLDAIRPEREPENCWRQFYASRFAMMVHQKLKETFLMSQSERKGGKIEGATLFEFMTNNMVIFQNHEAKSGKPGFEEVADGGEPHFSGEAA